MQSAALTEVFTGFGERGVPAEDVAERLARQVQSYLHIEAPVGPYLADQLLVPFALAGAGRLRTGPPTMHTRTNIAIIQRFLATSMSVQEGYNHVWDIAVG